MISKRSYYQLIPEKVYQNLSVIENSLRPEIKGYSTDYLKEIISIVACHVRKDDKEDSPLRAEYLRRLVPYAEKYLNGLIELEIIQRSPYYIPGQISYRYTFTPDYQSKYISLPVNNAKLIHRIKKAHSELGKDAVKLIYGHACQVRYLKQLTLADGWQELVESFKEDTNQYNAILASAMRIVNGDIFYSRDATEGRFHSNITNMKRELRQYLRVNNKPLTNIDIKNSQPYLSTIILTYPSKVAGLAKNMALSMLLQSLKVSQNEDVKHYIKLVADGLFYENLMQEFSLTRDETKIQVLRILFAPNRLPKNGINKKCRLIFKDRFPTVHRIFSKVRGRDQGTKFENSNRFAILLATIESYLMLDVIMKRIYKELPGTIAITIHDSIMTGILTNDVEAVRKIMADELTSFVGFAPKIKIEDYNSYLEKKEEDNNCIIQYDVTTSVSLN
ncbi:MAG: hypothetical protein MUC93_08545 [Bacteroidales bacterium]|nr:hypothetical protein [Bacteroidales bacterium]